MASAPTRPITATLAKYPIPIGLISALYRADADEFDRMVAAMPEYGRARVAAYCAENARLQPLGLKVARTCEEAALIRAAGAAVGASLFTRSRVEAATAH
ncbi:hypothetical protein Q8W71_06735 [Methylobacterium sp. NEAU 140]|uniref:hypothetical protein n=1 Tax=Methylobacterium sp. NEAU 140 TaxID=3064945 RepID=UPI002734985F|nr:hypothetical protein [Methylobacterium sp. NEAU 140]MDP4022312.1 hypothetical protein [Methylobacterium sp. NEAU 140]